MQTSIINVLAVALLVSSQAAAQFVVSCAGAPGGSAPRSCYLSTSSISRCSYNGHYLQPAGPGIKRGQCAGCGCVQAPPGHHKRDVAELVIEIDKAIKREAEPEEDFYNSYLFDTEFREVDCLWWCHEPQPGILFSAKSTQEVNALLSSIGRHVGSKLYLLDHVTATPSSLHVILSSRESKFSIDQIRTAISHAMNPGLLLSNDQLIALAQMGLLSPQHLPTAFPTLYTLDFESLDADDDVPSKPLEGMSPEERFRAEEDALVNPKTVLLRFIDLAPEAENQWLGAYAGPERGCGKLSTANGIMAEIGRQLDNKFYTVSSLCITSHEVSLMCNSSGLSSEKLRWLFTLAQYGGQPFDDESLKGYQDAGLL